LELNLFGKTSRGGVSCDAGVWGKEIGPPQSIEALNRIVDVVGYVSDGYNPDEVKLQAASVV
jgi:hypothetical protein